MSAALILPRLGISPDFTMVTMPNEALGSFVINPAAAASIFIFWMPLWACVWILGLFVATGFAESRATATAASPS